MVGTVYCLHHEEEDLLGSDPAPCPFCGFGAPEASEGSTDPLELEDSTDALQHALFSENEASERRSSPSDLRAYW